MPRSLGEIVPPHAVCAGDGRVYGMADPESRAVGRAYVAALGPRLVPVRCGDNKTQGEHRS